MINTNVEMPQVEEEVNVVSKRLPACSVNVVTVRSMEYFLSSQKQTPGIRIVVSGGQELDEFQEFHGVTINEQVTDINLWLSEKAQNMSLVTLKRLAEACGATEYLNVEAEALNEDFVNLIAPMFVGKQAVLSLQGDAVYKLKESGDGFWRNVYADANPYLNNTRNAPKMFESVEVFEKVQAYFEANPLYVSDKGEPQLQSQSASPDTADDDLPW